jgi:glucose dehydrogenase
MRYEGAFTPPSLQGSIVYPGNFGVFDWGGISVDPVRQIAFVNPSYMAFKSKLIPAADIAKQGPRVSDPRRAAEQRRAVRRDPRSHAVADGPAVPGASVGLCSGGRPDHPQNHLDAQERHRARQLAGSGAA